jgi:hypothetical protein
MLCTRLIHVQVTFFVLLVYLETEKYPDIQAGYELCPNIDK